MTHATRNAMRGIHDGSTNCSYNKDLETNWAIVEMKVYALNLSRRKSGNMVALPSIYPSIPLLERVKS